MIAALIPAAGTSSRLGRPKLLLELDGQTLIGHVVSSLRSGGAGRVIVVAPPADTIEGPAIAGEARRSGAEVVVPLERPREMRDSIELGLTTLARGECPVSVLLTPGDYPGITPAIVAQIVARSGERPDRLVVPIYHGRRGHPIVIPWKIATMVHSLPRDVGVNSLVARHSEIVDELVISSPAIVADLDTPEDLRHWEERRRPGGKGPGSPFRVSIRLFAIAKDRAGCSELEIELAPGSTVAGLRAVLRARLPALEPILSTVLIAVDEEYAGDDVLILPSSRLALIPPVSGGAGERRAFRVKASGGLS